MPKGEAIGIGDRNVQVHVREPDVACHSGTSFTANTRDGVLERQRASGQNARGGTGRAMVTERVEYPVAAASARCEGVGQSQAPQQQDPELRTRDGDIIAGGAGGFRAREAKGPAWDSSSARDAEVR